MEVWGSAVISPSGVWVEAPADKRFGAYWESKSAALVAAVFVLRTNVRVHSETRKKIVAGCNSSQGGALWKSVPMVTGEQQQMTILSL